jgi:hypothetical protein
MNRFAFVLIVISAALARSAADEPPETLIRENAAKATAILRGLVEARDTKPGQFTRTTFRVSTVFLGPFQPGETITYQSFRERASREEDGPRDLVVFLVDKRSGGAAPEWGTATDLSEFPASPSLLKRVTHLKRKK